MKLNEHLLDIHVTHEHSYGPWAIVQIVDGEYVRVCDIDNKGNFASRAFLAWIPKLKPFLYKPHKDDPLQEKPFTEEQVEFLNAMRSELASGKKKVIYTHIVKV